MKLRGHVFETLFICLFVSTPHPLPAQAIEPLQISYNEKTYPLYPGTLDEIPNIPSPTTQDGVDILLACTKDDRYALIPVTVENGAPLHYSHRVKSVFGKDRQLEVDSGDFPTLARTGRHADEELEKEMITGFPVSLITYIGRPGRFSGAGFMAEDEDIISVLKADNRLVEKMGLTHAQTAKPLFHVWNVILKEIELGKWARYWDNIGHFYYNGREVTLKAHGTKGWQISIFQDEIQGSFDMEISSVLTSEEKALLKQRYPHLSADQLIELEQKLSAIHFSEMAPYYIMRYGFYEGHTAYRSDPIAIAFIFGLKSLAEIDDIFQGKLDRVLTSHFTKDVTQD
ncbi:hypothetical protein JW998_13135 [candidate division KSB1 bacterium]|nr:hypothetical protein [candidate division KSB1 bacterium]